MIYAGSFIILLGILVFVHEFGHFIVAKFAGVKVEIFSLGFGKSLLKKKVGETLYQIALFPLGGFVKLYGQDPTDEVDPMLKIVSFRHQSLLKRFLIVFAGPFFNIVLAILVFSIIYLIGSPSISTKISDLRYGSNAWEAGLKVGDTIEAINGEQVKDWEGLSNILNNIEADKVKVKTKTGEFDVKISKLLANNKFGQMVRMPQIDGLSPYSLSSLVGVVENNSIAASMGFKTGDLVLELNDEKLEKWSDLEDKLLTYKEGQIKVKIKRQETYITLFLNGRSFPANSESREYKYLDGVIQDLDYSLANELGFFPAELFVSGFVKEGSAAKKVGLLEGDRLIAINETLLRRHIQLQNIVDEIGRTGNDLNILIDRKGEILYFKIKPNEMSIDSNNIGIKDKRFLLGIETYYLPGPIDKTEVKETNVFKALFLGFSKTLDWVIVTLLGFWKLITGSVSFKALGGPLMLGKVAGDSMSLGIVYFLKIVAIISINLGLINLFPIPILDGGHILFYSIEFVIRRPLKDKYINFAQQFGFYVLVGLMVLAFYNDLARYSDYFFRLFK